MLIGLDWTRKLLCSLGVLHHNFITIPANAIEFTGLYVKLALLITQLRIGCFIHCYQRHQ